MKYLILLSETCARADPAPNAPVSRPSVLHDRRRLTRALALAGLAVMAVLGGCATAPDPLEASFGLATECTRAMQTADPMASWHAWHHRQAQQLPRTDGVNARLGVAHYRARMASPQAPLSVIGKEQP